MDGEGGDQEDGDEIRQPAELDGVQKAFQAWLLTASEDEVREVLSRSRMREAPNSGGHGINVISMAVGLPAGGHADQANYWAALAAGTDGQTKTPFSRFDMDLYYRNENDWTPGWTYTWHGAYVCEDIFAFDNKLFNVPEAEAYVLGPAHRQILEKGYEALYRAGFRKAKLKGQHIGVFCGHSGDDWGAPGVTFGDQDCHRAGYASRIWGTIAGRLSFAMGMTGPQTLIDTACSSSLVAYGVGHTMLRRTVADRAKTCIGNDLTQALMTGVNLMPGPGNYINLCGPHMLSGHGRCFTFDYSADGFARGEGTGAFYVRVEETMSFDALATVIGACLNQDGRSASMTAPNGPAQQECIRGSMREAGLTASEVTCAECHGTGTALGDPIEVGALRGVMKDRVAPLLQVSAKSHIGHLEAAAGQAGMIKCILMCRACAGTPNCHLVSLNPHLEVSGYPTLFDSELVDYSASSGLSGVSSFGFGGANSRADVFAHAAIGHHASEVDYVDLSYVDGPWNTAPS